MLESTIKKKLLYKLENLIAEKNVSEHLRNEFISWINSGKPFFDVMNDSEKRILKNYPNLVVKKDLYFNIYSTLKWGDKLFGNKIFDFKERALLDEDTSSFYCFTLTTYPSLFDSGYNSTPLSGSNKKLSEMIGAKLCQMVRVRKKYLEKREFIKRVLDSRDLTLTLLKNNYKDLYDLL